MSTNTTNLPNQQPISLSVNTLYLFNILATSVAPCPFIPFEVQEAETAGCFTFEEIPQSMC